MDKKTSLSANLGRKNRCFGCVGCFSPAVPGIWRNNPIILQSSPSAWLKSAAFVTGYPKKPWMNTIYDNCQSINQSNQIILSNQIKSIKSHQINQSNQNGLTCGIPHFETNQRSQDFYTVHLCSHPQPISRTPALCNSVAPWASTKHCSDEDAPGTIVPWIILDILRY